MFNKRKSSSSIHEQQPVRDATNERDMYFEYVLAGGDSLLLFSHWFTQRQMLNASICSDQVASHHQTQSLTFT